MCLIVMAKCIEDEKPKIAKHDIEVWKILYYDFTPIYNSLFIGNNVKSEPYTREQEYYITGKPFCIRWSRKDQAKNIDETCGMVEWSCFHSYKSINKSMIGWEMLQGQYIAVSFIIPKGAKYYKGKHSDGNSGYVSDRIIFPETAKIITDLE